MGILTAAPKDSFEVVNARIDRLAEVFVDLSAQDFLNHD